MEKTCSVPGCVEPVKGIGYCGPHLERLRRCGDVMPDQPIRKTGMNLRLCQEIANADHGDECVIWPGSRGTVGYPAAVQFNGRRERGHRVICALVHGPEPTGRPFVAHSCGNGQKGCVNPRHLRWASASENMQDKLIHGSHNRGEAHHQSKLKKDQVREILSLSGINTVQELATKYGVSVMTISAILRGKKWGWLDPETPRMTEAKDHQATGKKAWATRQKRYGPSGNPSQPPGE